MNKAVHFLVQSTTQSAELKDTKNNLKEAKESIQSLKQKCVNLEQKMDDEAKNKIQV